MSTISNERLEKIAAGGGFNFNEVEDISAELLALRKEREQAEPVYYGPYTPVMMGAGVWVSIADELPPHLEGREVWVTTAPPAPVVGDDSLPYDPQIAEYEQMMEAEQAQADTTAQQFESLAGKAVGGSEGFECTPVADLYELLTKCGECYDYTTSAKVAADWIKEGYSAREYVKLDRLQEAMTQGSSGEDDGWIPCRSECRLKKTLFL